MIFIYKISRINDLWRRNLLLWTGNDERMGNGRFVSFTEKIKLFKYSFIK